MAAPQDTVRSPFCAADAEARVANQRRLRTLAQGKGDAVRLFCAHDLLEFETLAAQPVAGRSTTAAPAF